MNRRLAMLKPVLAWVRATKWSVLACVLTLILGLASMGLLGALLYFSVAPPLWLLGFPSQDGWHGDWVWPAMILTGMAWAFGFLVAGGVNRVLVNRGVRPALRRMVYVAILWLWALAIWLVTLASVRSQGSL